MDDRSYDFIHSRYMACSLKDWPTYMRRVYEWVVVLPDAESGDYPESYN